MQESLTHYRDVFVGKTVTLIGAAKTTVDFEQYAKEGTDSIVIVNWALGSAHHFQEPRHDLYFMTWHMEIFGERPEILQPNLKCFVYPAVASLLPPEKHTNAIVFEAVNHPDYAEWKNAMDHDQFIRNPDLIVATNQLHSSANSTLLALHFLYMAGCRKVNCIGMHDINDVQDENYDARHNADSGHKPVHKSIYMTCQNDFAQAMGMELNYLE